MSEYVFYLTTIDGKKGTVIAVNAKNAVEAYNAVSKRCDEKTKDSKKKEKWAIKDVKKL